jgi:hypothetical protein
MKDSISIKEFLEGLRDPQDGYYFASECLKDLLKKFDHPEGTEIHHEILHCFDYINDKADLCGDLEINEGLYDSPHWTILQSWCESGLPVRSRNKILVRPLSNFGIEYITANENRLKISIKELKDFCVQHEIPLPAFLFPNEKDNSKKAYEIIRLERSANYFDAFVDDTQKGIEECKTIKPSSIVDYYQREMAIRLMSERYEKEKIDYLIGNGHQTPRMNLDQIPTDVIIAVLHYARAHPKELFLDLQTRGIPLKDLGYLAASNDRSVVSESALIKRAQRYSKNLDQKG